MVEGEIGIAQIVEAPTSFDRVGIGPAGPGAKGVEVEME
jgi:hypothetical protein